MTARSLCLLFAMCILALASVRPCDAATNERAAQHYREGIAQYRAAAADRKSARAARRAAEGRPPPHITREESGKPKKP